MRRIGYLIFMLMIFSTMVFSEAGDALPKPPSSI